VGVDVPSSPPPAPRATAEIYAPDRESLLTTMGSRGRLLCWAEGELATLSYHMVEQPTPRGKEETV